MLSKLRQGLAKKHVPFFLVPDHNNLDKLEPEMITDYYRSISRTLNTLNQRLNANYLTNEDLHDIFGIEVEEDEDCNFDSVTFLHFIKFSLLFWLFHYLLCTG